MLKKEKGFTLIEMLIVVAIIGILAALLIPNAMSALQKAKMRGTQKDIGTIATTLMDYLTDKGNFSALPLSGPVTAQDFAPLQGLYAKALSINDQWGNPFACYTGSATNVYGLAATTATDEYVVASWGRDGTAEGWSYDAANPESGLFQITSTADFDKDIVNWNGSMIRGPRAGSTTTT